MAGKKKGKLKIVLVVLVVILLAALGFGVIKTGLLPLPGIGGGDDVRTTQTRDSKKSEKKLKELISIEDIKIRETEYGLLELSGTGRFPDFSVYFEEHNKEAAETGDAMEYEKRLLALTAEDLKGEKKASKKDSGKGGADGPEGAEDSSVPYVTRKLTVDLSAVDGSRGKDEWKDKELEELLRQAAFDSELEEFALKLMGDYLSRSTDWEAEKAVWTEEAAGGNGTGTAGGNSAEAAGKGEVQTP